MQKGVQLQGGSFPDPTRGSARGPRWGPCPHTPVIGSRSMLTNSGRESASVVQWLFLLYACWRRKTRWRWRL